MEWSILSWSLTSLSITLKALAHASLQVRRVSVFADLISPGLWYCEDGAFTPTRTFLWFRMRAGSRFLTMLLTRCPFFPCPSKTPPSAPSSIPKPCQRRWGKWNLYRMHHWGAVIAHGWNVFPFTSFWARNWKSSGSDRHVLENETCFPITFLIKN